VVFISSLFQALQSLVDYDEDSDDEQTPEDDDVNSLNSSSKRQKLDNTWTWWTLVYIQKVLQSEEICLIKIIIPTCNDEYVGIFKF